jgi:hypothetical protein
MTLRERETSGAEPIGSERPRPAARPVRDADTASAASMQMHSSLI